MNNDSVELKDVLQHYGVKGMKWGVRRTPKQILYSAISNALGLGGRDSSKADTRSEKAATEILQTPLSALNGGRSSSPSYRRVGDSRTISRGEKIAEKYLDKTVRAANAASSLI